ncbi:type II CRISPR RNA-guided endonuclease Cas9 [Staphylococcus devriesei]|uniref:type II CRISPR RNA-guided endonuclease Cas9 n=1 Tax=Staphylococcus devriesei TaxID=586733 RepID=UPI001F5415AB|nr:type II CRISPR RNA-guided endonuclease Cas9 [Staphylococcus devriesei]
MVTKYILGLDIGITSVGYGIINYEDKTIIDAGVRLFPEANVENNEGRRSKRGARRLKRRRIHRLDRITQLLSEYNLVDLDNIPQSPSPYEIRVKGLREELSKDELVIALLHIAKRRGIHNVEAVDETQDEGNELSTKEQLAKNNNLLKDKYVCELLLERLKDGKVRGEKNRFKTTDIIKEVKQLLETQKEAHQLDDDFINRYIDLIETRREYFEGPGKGSPFGWGGDLKKMV